MRLLSLLTLAVSLTAAQYSPPESTGFETVDASSIFEGAKIEYKKTELCASSYSGYLHLPASDSRPYSQALYFWYFPSQKKATHKKQAPLALWLGGGPGSSSTSAVLGGNGPCVLTSSNATEPNPHSWTKYSDVLYIDQPVQTGFSYDIPTNGTVDQLTPLPNPIIPLATNETIPTANNTLNVGTFGSQIQSSTAQTTRDAARSLWSALQVLLATAPFAPQDPNLSLWTESYGGRYGPIFMQHFHAQNTAIAAGTLTTGKKLRLNTLGVMNGWVDMVTQARSYIDMSQPANNGYGITLMNATTYTTALEEAVPECNAKNTLCRTLASQGDPHNLGTNATVNAACSEATAWCISNVRGLLDPSISLFDISQSMYDPFPANTFVSFFSRHWVQQELGVRVNQTANSPTVLSAFSASGDFSREEGIAALGELVDAGVNVALVYGDRDMQCNHLGGVAVAELVRSKYSRSWAKAGYADVKVGGKKKGVVGWTKQAGGFSFTRVKQSGHSVSWFQPAVMEAVFSRMMAGMDVATGKTKVLDCDSGSSSNGNSKYRSRGRKSTKGIEQTPPKAEAALCNIWVLMATCTDEQREAVVAGTAVVDEDFIVVG